jgi:tRNA-dihydrouridine synthase C
MEGVGDSSFRKAIATIGGFDEAVRDFIRVPREAHVESLAVKYDPDELSPIPLIPQIMGSEPPLMAAMAVQMQQRRAPRIDLNCGCPSNTVTGRGAGSSLLKNPTFVYEVAKAMVQAVSIPVTVKLRSGFDDLSLFRENLLAAQESGAAFITLHPRTKADGYGPPARWDLIAEAKQLLSIPVVGNGDLLTADDALRMLQQTGCDALMIGRGSLINPFLFHEIRSRFSLRPFETAKGHLFSYLKIYRAKLPVDMAPRMQVNKLKQLLGFLYKKSPELLQQRQAMLTSQALDPDLFLEEMGAKIIPLQEGQEMPEVAWRV